MEIKLTGLPTETDKSKIYFWLILDKSEKQMGKLVFISMKSENGKEERIFAQGKLTFNATSGTFETKQKRYLLKNLSTSRLPEKIEKIIQDYFSELTE